MLITTMQPCKFTNHPKNLVSKIFHFLRIKYHRFNLYTLSVKRFLTYYSMLHHYWNSESTLKIHPRFGISVENISEIITKKM